ncbi:MAG: hypothetical protein F6K19_01420 [Cyanothece sp. SIO1E1]|nr:hypothetical protein [Cyanothece sp. SIO1E1]
MSNKISEIEIQKQAENAACALPKAVQGVLMTYEEELPNLYHTYVDFLFHAQNSGLYFSFFKEEERKDFAVLGEFLRALKGATNQQNSID